MIRSAVFAVALALVVTLTGCAGQTVAEEDLPTRVPQLDAQALAAAAQTARPTARPTATGTPLPPTPTPEPTPTLEPTATDTPLPPTPVPTAEPALEPTAEPAAAQDPESPAALNGGDAITRTSEITITAELTSAGGLTGAEAAIASDAVTETATASRADTESTAEPESPASAETSGGVADAAASPEDVDPRYAGMPESFIAAMADADPDRGETLTLSIGCTGCHSLDPNQFMAGPTWYNMSQTAGARVEGQSAGHYLLSSIMQPNEYVVENFQPNIMLQTYGETIPPRDIADIIAYLLTIRGR